MAGLASGILSHVSSVLNSSSTVFTMDLYKPLLGRGKPDKHLIRVGRWSGFAILAVATVLAIWLSHRQVGIFVAVQKVGMWVAAPGGGGLPDGCVVAGHDRGRGDLRAGLWLSLHVVC